jgi:hypothetical protein
MANGAFKFKDNSGNVVAALSNSGSNIVISGGTLDLSGMTGLTLGNVTMSGTTENASTASFAPSYLLSSSFNSYTGTTNAQLRLSSLEIVTSSLATTGSNQFKNNQTITGSLTVTGYIEAQELRTTYISSSILYRSGSTKFGDELSDIHSFSGSLNVSGSITTTSSATFSGTMSVTGEVRSINGGVDGTFSDAFVGVYSSNNNEQNSIQTAVSSNAGLSGFRFQVSNGGGSSGRTTVVDFLRDRQIFYTNVGIGTSTPSALLHLSSASPYIYLDDTSTSGTKNRFQIISGDVGTTQSGIFSFNNTSGTALLDVLTVNELGRVGIGTTNPTKTLVVNGRMSTTAIVSGNLVAGNIYSNISTSPSFIIICNLNNAAGFSLSGKINAASYTCWNISDVYIRKDYSALTGAAVITGVAKSGCDFSVVDISYNGDRFIALRFTGNPEIDVMWTGYRLAELFQSDGTATVLTSGVSVNSTYASY